MLSIGSGIGAVPVSRRRNAVGRYGYWEDVNMSTPDTGMAALVDQVVRDAKDLLASEREEAKQLDMLDPIDPEDMLEARVALGPNAGNLAVLAKAREVKRGRPPGARNKRTDDFARYLLSFGQHPAITMMQVQATAPEVLIENSRRLRRRKRKENGVEIDLMQTMSYGEALSLKIRCAEGLLPYLESKKPIAIDATIRGVRIIEEIGSSKPLDQIEEGEFRAVDPDKDPS
jgi:hypothetical protein